MTKLANLTSKALLASTLCLLALAAPALAGPPAHVPLPAQNIEGLNHACGAAVDSEGDVYAASAGESKVKVYDPSHDLLTEIPNANEPCSLAVDSRGVLYVSEQATGNVVRYAPDAYPLTPSPTYSGPSTFVNSGNAKGIGIDPSDNRLYVAEGTRVSVFQSDGTTGQNEVRPLSIGPNVTGGSFTLGFESQNTAPIPVVPAESKPSTAEIQSALEALPAIGPGNVSVRLEEPDRGDYIGDPRMLIAFTRELGSKDVSALSADSSGLSGGAVGVGGPLDIQNGYEFDGHIGEGELTDATAVAPYTYDPIYTYETLLNVSGTDPQRYLFVADSASDEVVVFSGSKVKELALRDSIDGKEVPDTPACPDCSAGFGFGAQGAALATDWASGHVLVYDAEHEVLDEFEASGRFLDQVVSPSFEDAEPTGLALLPERSAMQEVRIEPNGASFQLSYEGVKTAPLAAEASLAQVQAALEALPGIGPGNVSVGGHLSASTKIFLIRFTGALAKRRVGGIGLYPSSGVFTRARRFPGAGPGRLYVSAGAGPGAKLLAFGPLAAPSRAPIDSLSRVLKAATSVTVDQKGFVYVVAGVKVHVFGPGGEPLLQFQDLEEPVDLAVDSSGKIYVADAKGAGGGFGWRVTYYTPSSYPPTATTTYTRHEPAVISPGGLEGKNSEAIAIDPSDDRLFVAAASGNLFELESAAEGSDLIGKFAPGFNFGSRPEGIDVHGATGAVYVSEGQGFSAGISVMDASGTKRLARINGSGSPNGLFVQRPTIAVDQSNGHVLTFSPPEGGQEFEASGGFVAEFNQHLDVYGSFDIAIDNSGGPSEGNVYTALDDQNPATPDLRAFGPLSYGEAPLVVAGIADGLGGGEATLHGTVNPRGFELEECRFEYVDEESFESEGGFASPDTLTVPCAESIAEVGEGKDPVAVHAQSGPLADPEARHRFRLVAENEFGPDEDEGLFGPPLIADKAPKPVLYREATLRAGLDPSGLETSYRFEYGASEAYGRSTPTREMPAGDGEVAVKETLVGLAEGTTYHFRLLAENEAGTKAGPDQAFTTQSRPGSPPCPNAEYRTGPSADLPDCRAYELVSPADTAGGLIRTAIDTGSIGDGFNNWLTPPRGPAAGRALSFVTTATLQGFEGSGVADGYRAERAPGEHPPAGWGTELVSPSHLQLGGSEGGAGSLGIASDQLYSLWLNRQHTFEGTLPEGVYLRTPSGFEPVARGSLGIDLDANTGRPYHLAPGGTHVIFSSDDQLEEAAPPAGTEAIYDRAAGSTGAEVISREPNGAVFSADAAYLNANEAGTAVAFEVAGDLYLHRDGIGTIQAAAAPNSFAGVSEDGKRIFFSDAVPVLGVAAFPPGNLFLCEAEGGSCAGPEASQEATQIAPEGIFVHVSDDGESVLFTSEEVLDQGGEGIPGEPNLYLWDGTGTTLVAVLDPQDLIGFGGGSDVKLDTWIGGLTPGDTLGRGRSPARSAAAGEAFVFQSHAQLSAYENEGAGQVYRYEPAAPASQRILCVSCPRSGEAPGDDAMLQDISGSPLDAKVLIPNITADGRRVFFHSPDRLMPEDANDAQDVYEWRAQGESGCTDPSGCLALISTGQGENRAVIFAMSEDGRDVFFTTFERLVAADIPGSASIYDARVGGGIPETVIQAPCQGDSCQGQGTGAPALPGPTSTAAAGDKPPGKARPRCAKNRRRVVRRGKARCVKRHRAKQADRNRRGRR